jgi:hypothetical protein
LLRAGDAIPEGLSPPGLPAAVAPVPSCEFTLAPAGAAQRRTPIQRIARFPGWLATHSQVVSLRSGSNVLRSLSPKPRLRVA